MSLIKCPECEKEISDQAASCPHCGHPVSRDNPDNAPAPAQAVPENVPAPKKRNIQKLLSVIIILIGVVGMVSGKAREFWLFLIVAGLAWFIVLRILRD